jgi:hypothetical protein
VANRADAITSPLVRSAREHTRSGVSRAEIAKAVGRYYGDSTAFYGARVGRRVVHLSVLADQDWVGLAVPLGGDAELCPPARRGDGPPIRLTDIQVRSALDRLAIAEVTDTVMVNNPLFCLTDLEIGNSHLAAQFECVDFAAYCVDSRPSRIRTARPRMGWSAIAKSCNNAAA